MSELWLDKLVTFLLAHIVDVHGAVTRLAVNDRLSGLSVYTAHDELVICRDVGKISEFSSHTVI